MPAPLTGRQRSFLLPAILLLSGCASATDLPASARTVAIAQGVTLTLPAPAALGRTVEAAQLVTAHYRDTTFVFEGHIVVTPDRFLLVGLDTMGRRALTVTWTAGGVVAEVAPWLPDTTRPGNMLADIVMMYWPEGAVRGALTGATLVTAPGSRIVRKADGTEVVRIDYGIAQAGSWSGRMKLRNLAWGYDIDVQSGEAGP